MQFFLEKVTINVMRFCRTVSRKLGNTFFTSLLFLFILAATLRVCTNKTLQESKLTNVFVQETQSYYLLENLMALGRDYAYQLTQNPKMPNLLLSVFAYRDKDKSQKNTGTIIDFNGSLSKEQIVPKDFPLQISSWDIKAGPIFWQDKKKDEDDERYLSEVFLLGELGVNSNLVPNWKARIVQTMEIERNPLCDFQLYAEGDTLINGNITHQNDDWLINFYGPVQINGNTRFQFYGGINPSSGTHGCYFYDKVNLAGHALRIQEKGSSAKSTIIPQKFCFYDVSDFYDKFTNPYSIGTVAFKFNPYTSNTSSNLTNLSNFSNNNSISDNYANYEQSIFNTFKGNFMTRGRVYRPSGFDPISDWGYWYPKEEGGSSENARALNMCFGLHNLCKSAANGGWYSLYSGTNSRAANAASALRELDAYQMTEKARLVETQKAINSPGFEVRLLLKTDTEVNEASLKVPINFPYVTYNSAHFPAINDNFYLNYYLKLKFQENSIFSDLKFRRNIYGSGNHYNATKDSTPNSSGFKVGGDYQYVYWQVIQDNKLVVKSVDYNQYITDKSLDSIFITKKGFGLVGYNDSSSPPHKLIDSGDHWTLDSTQLRLHTTELGYQFIYDRNRAKWIQLLDIDIKALKEEVAKGNGVLSGWESTLNCTLKINVYSQIMKTNANCNYKSYDSTQKNSEDIRFNYVSKRTNFLNSYGDGSYLYSSSFKPVIDVGVRLIEAEELPEGGLTLICPYPLYIKGDFNTVNTKPKACIITDSLTLLSDDWQDWRSSMDFGTSYLYSSDGKSCDPNITPPTIYAHVITGRTHPNYWLKDNGLFPDFGIHDAFRTLEDFSKPLKFYGSLLLPYYCQHQWEPPIDFGHSNRTPHWFAYVPFYLGEKGKEWKKMRTTPGMPTYLKVNRGRKTQTIGSIFYDKLVNDIIGTETEAKNYTFSNYHSDLPNFLKYPKDP